MKFIAWLLGVIMITVVGTILMLGMIRIVGDIIERGDAESVQNVCKDLPYREVLDSADEKECERRIGAIMEKANENYGNNFVRGS